MKYIGIVLLILFCSCVAAQTYEKEETAKLPGEIYLLARNSEFAVYLFIDKTQHINVKRKYIVVGNGVRPVAISE
jgi:hypothetical protein